MGQSGSTNNNNPRSTTYSHQWYAIHNQRHAEEQRIKKVPPLPLLSFPHEFISKYIFGADQSMHRQPGSKRCWDYCILRPPTIPFTKDWHCGTWPFRLVNKKPISIFFCGPIPFVLGLKLSFLPIPFNETLCCFDTGNNLNGWKASKELKQFFFPVIKILRLSGCRLQEVSHSLPGELSCAMANSFLIFTSLFDTLNVLRGMISAAQRALWVNIFGGAWPFLQWNTNSWQKYTETDQFEVRCTVSLHCNCFFSK